MNVSMKQYGNIQEETSIKTSQTQYQNLDGLLNIKGKKRVHFQIAEVSNLGCLKSRNHK